jgi:imidazolonepropionase
VSKNLKFEALSKRKIMSSILIKNIKQLVGIATAEELKSAFYGARLSKLETIENAYLWLVDGKIKSFGTMQDELALKLDLPNSTLILDASGRIVLPGYVDSHTHLVFAATREKEFCDRINGLSYEEIAARGGGILNSARKMKLASEEQLLEAAWIRLQEVIKQGTTAIEIKSGYGLDVENELKMLRVIRRLKEISPISIKTTLLAGHAYPMEYRENHEGFLKIVEEELIPNVAREGLAEYIDVFCEKGFFSVEETARIMDAGAKFGMKSKIHANQLHHSGGIEIGVAKGAISVDHCECVGEAEISALKGSATLPTLLPGAAFFLGIGYQPGRKMIDAGLPIVLASDYNPGSCPSGNMNFVMSLACTQMKLTPAEALHASTINGAHALELGQQMGAICEGYAANVLITEPMEDYSVIPYSFGTNRIEKVIVNGKLL